jgi:1,4-alpha-glucan branching enzyme
VDATSTAPSPTPEHSWQDAEYMGTRRTRNARREPISIYQVHLGSFRRVPEEGNRPLTYHELAQWLPEHAGRLGFTHVEILPDAATRAPFSPAGAHGGERDFVALVDALHRRGLGVLWGNLAIDAQGGWSDAEIDRALGRVDLLHGDGIRAAITRPPGGSGQDGAEAFLRRLNERFHSKLPGAFTIASEASLGEGSGREAHLGTFGFDFAWDRSFGEDMIAYLGEDPIGRKWRHDEITTRRSSSIGLPIVLPISHDLADAGKPSLLSRMHGDTWQKFASLRLLYAFAFTLPGKKLLFMGSELGQESAYNPDGSLDWHLIEGDTPHRRIQHLVGELNGVYRAERSLHDGDDNANGFSWLEERDAERSIVAFQRRSPDAGDVSIVILNFTPVPRTNHRIGVPLPGFWDERLNTDAPVFGGSGQGNFGGVEATPLASHGQPFSLNLTLPPLGAIVLEPRHKATARR